MSAAAMGADVHTAALAAVAAVGSHDSHPRWLLGMLAAVEDAWDAEAAGQSVALENAKRLRKICCHF